MTRGRRVLSFATRKIKKGEEIQDVYSGTALRSSKEEREEVHARYNFTCCCQACIENWPTEQGWARNVTRRQVKENVTDKVIKQMDRDLKDVTSVRWYDQVSAQTALTRLVSLLSQTSDYVRSPNYLVAKAEELLHSALWSLHR